MMKIYSVFDHKAKAFAQPWFQLTDGLAIRAFTEACNDAQTNLNKYPEDFVLYCVGTFDETTGTITADQIEPMVRAIQVLRDVPKSNVVPIKKEEA